MPARLTLHPLERGGLREVRIIASGSVSIGRGSDNDWVLPDPDRHLSKTHCAISVENGRLVLTDLSTNGLYLNGSSQPTSRNSRTVLASGDEFRLGDYRIAVDEAVGSSAVDVLPGPASPPPVTGRDPFAETGPDSDPLDDLLGGPVTPAARSGFRHPAPPATPQGRGEDPFDSFEQDQRSGRDPTRDHADRHAQTRPDAFPADADDDLFRGSGPADPWRGPAQRDDAEAPRAAFKAPKPVVPMSLDELDALLGDVEPEVDSRPTGLRQSQTPAPFPVPPSASRPAPPVVEPITERSNDDAGSLDTMPGSDPVVRSAAVLASDPAADPWGEPADDAFPAAPVVDVVVPDATTTMPETEPGGAVASATGLAAFLQGAGLRALPQGPGSDEVLHAAGAIFRDLVEGLREVLMSRAAIKNEFRLEQTMLRARDNNALKFSVTVEEALLALLVPDRAGYMRPSEAVREAFSDIRSHEMAVMAGVQTALLGLLRRFDPPTLEARLQPNMLGQLLPGSRKARNWELFCATYAEIAREAEDDFQTVFGREFARAYGAHARKT